LLINKFKRHISHHYDQAHQNKHVIFLSLWPLCLSCLCRILATVSDAASLSKLPVDKFTDLFVKA
jgi:2-methylcitrate dehydratase